MAFFQIPNVSLTAVYGCVPEAVEKNTESPLLTLEERDKVLNSIGIAERRVAGPQVTTGDLCLKAAREMLADLRVDLDRVSVLVFVSQTPDYGMPATACILQNKLGLPKTTMAFDVNLGCSGYVYGLSVISGLLSRLEEGQMGLLLVGDTLSKTVSPRDRTVALIFGDGGSASLLTRKEGETMAFQLNSDGAGAEAIIMGQGGFREPMNILGVEEYADLGEGIFRRPRDLRMTGLDVFNFTLREVLPNIDGLLANLKISRDGIDLYFLHQANKMINDLLSRRLKVGPAKVPMTLQKFGNTSSATIPLGIADALLPASAPRTMVLSGFGVGLSWGSAYVKIGAEFRSKMCVL